MLKYMKIYEYLRRKIDQNKFGDSTLLPSEAYISNRFKVSRETVRKAITRLEDEKLVYSVRGSGTYFYREKAQVDQVQIDPKRKKVAIIVQGQDQAANRQLIDAINSTLEPKGIFTSIFYTDNKLANERKCLESCLEQNFNGLIIDGVKSNMVNPNLDVYARFSEKKIPLIFYNNYYIGTQFPRIVIDELACADMLVKQFVDAGHNHIAGIFLYDNSQGVSKYQGFIEAVIRYGIVYDDSFVKLLLSDDMINTSKLDRNLKNFLKSIPECTGVICSNIMLMKSVIRIAEQMNWRIPEDISITCFDYSDDDYTKEGYTCSIHPGGRIGEQAAEQLLKMMNDETWMKKDFNVFLKPRIFFGKSIYKLNS